ncbi:DNA excision repair protein Rad2 [Penicillium digitatum]|uniref:DNA excision repair protein Rad2 n=3 Tax=Penicillium digitatum TaxID=36651 RepID=K9FJ02_PEND2|nr:DNA excision repair protein Rad2 [Penicillium digitatum Pd1]EKV08085.1 DNA excision repair protein Rad2 [Penicillium digitatum Pd1]EKV09495.1 DNA excision repair protein Rad2 [Penicillium digitatum PHI26]QQK41532.1 DNA excision repair protein Rad2 [Penicillium digitatum]
MGVTGLWTVVQPCARPIKLETLNKKRLAVDASIWIYQFLKAVRDKEGNALRNSHIVGFFRRICKLLYFGIRPVFVFDGGAPVMKRQTIAGRKKKREGHREDAARTAGKLLAVQMQRSAEEENARRRNKSQIQEEEEVPDAPVYAEEAFMTETEKQQSRKFKKKDAYHLPNLDVSLQDMGAPNDPRIMSQEELEEYARTFHQGQDINLYDFSKIDFDSMFFLSLPPTDRYNILNAARLRSRLRMGYSKEQLDTMFPDRMAFSRFQIDRVAERNDLTQRLMNLNGMNGEEAFYKSGQRIAGERGREYVLVKDREHEGGWVLGVVGNREGHEEKPIDLDRPEIFSDEDEVSDEDEFEDVPIEGLNRLPKLPFLQEGVFDQSLQLETDEYLDMGTATQESRHPAQRQLQNEPRVQEVEDDSLFVEAEGNIGAQQRSNNTDDFFDGDDDDLERAIALSLQPDKANEEIKPDVPVHRPVVSGPSYEMLPDLESESDDGMDFTAAIARTKVVKKASHAPNPFGGPLPFESIKLTKVTKDNDKAGEVGENAGGFVEEPTKKPKQADPLPPWFIGERSDASFIVDPIEDTEKDDERTAAPDHLFLSNRRSLDIIDVDEFSSTKEVVDLEEEDEEQGEEKPKQEFQVEDIEKIYNELSTNLEEKPLSEPAPAQIHRNFDETVLGGPGTQIQDQVPTLDERSTRSKHSPSPEFEDVVPQLSTQGPEITVVSHQKAQPQPQPQFFEEIDQLADFVQDQADYSDPEDEELFKQLAAEGEEHVRFANTLNSAAPIQEAFDYEQELKQLRSQQRNERRDADEVTTIMINECQQLLALFGLPYITAPMEAEAQCAKLVSLGLVDGIVTDDSDIFLFGGTRVYKNMFNQSKFVECYLTSDLEKEYALHRQKLISFAHLLGSDYTEGIPGIGPVTALEILTEFSNLEEFRNWWTELQMGTNNAEDVHLAFRKKFRKKASKIFLPPSFPDSKVDEAYLEPAVDDDPSPFQWGVPDLNGLRTFLMTTIGWSQERTDEVLVPVIRDMNRRDQEGTQSNITQFMQGPQGAGAFAPRVRTGGPSRMEKAFSRLRREAQSGGSSSLDDEPAVEDREGEDASVPQKKGKRGVSTTKAKAGTNKKRKTRRTNSPES